MRAFVVGFYQCVGDAVRSRLGGGDQEVEVLPFQSQDYPVNFKRVRAALWNRIKDGRDEPLLVIAAVDHRSLTLRELLEQIQAQAKGTREFELEFLPDLQNSGSVLERLEKFGFSTTGQERDIDPKSVAAFLNGHAALCVRGQNQSSFHDCLVRAGLRRADFEAHFKELLIEYGPNVVRDVKIAAAGHPCVLYAFRTLKYIDPHALKGAGIRLFQGQNPTDAIARFLEAVRAGQPAESANKAGKS